MSFGIYIAIAWPEATYDEIKLPAALESLVKAEYETELSSSENIGLSGRRSVEVSR